MSEPLTADSLKAILDEFKASIKAEVSAEASKVANIAVGQRLKSYEDKEKRQGASAPKASGKEDLDDEDLDPGPGGDWKIALGKERKARKDLEAALANEKREAQMGAAYSKVREYISPHVLKGSEETIIKLLKADGLVSLEDGKAYFGPSKLDLQEGASAWLGSSDGALFKASANQAPAAMPFQGFTSRPAIAGDSFEAKYDAIANGLNSSIAQNKFI